VIDLAELLSRSLGAKAGAKKTSANDGEAAAKPGPKKVATKEKGEGKKRGTA
jgi:hypothetical protein